MLAVISCNGYGLIGTANNRADALRIAREHEDGTYDCIIYQDSRIIGDKSGYYDRDQFSEERYVDAATQTGMYDRGDF